MEREIQEKLFVEELVKLRNSNISVLYFEAPVLGRETSDKSKWEQYIIDNDIVNRDTWQKNGEGFQKAFELSGYADKYTLEDYRENLARAVPTIPCKNYQKHQDISGKYDNVVEGNRIVTNSPNEYRQRVLVFGDSAARGMFLEDKDTSASKLQGIFIANKKEDIKVENLAVRTATFSDLANHIADTPIGINDIVIVIRRGGTTSSLFYETLRDNNIDYYISTPDFCRPHNFGEVFLDTHHPNWNGNQAIAELIYREICKGILEVLKTMMMRLMKVCYVSYLKRKIMAKSEN